MKVTTNMGETMEMISFYGGCLPTFIHPNTQRALLKHKFAVKKKCNHKSNTTGFRFHLTPKGKLAVAFYKAGKQQQRIEDVRKAVGV